MGQTQTLKMIKVRRHCIKQQEKVMLTLLRFCLIVVQTQTPKIMTAGRHYIGQQVKVVLTLLRSCLSMGLTRGLPTMRGVLP